MDIVYEAVQNAKEIIECYFTFRIYVATFNIQKEINESNFYTRFNAILVTNFT